jgi:hypothetical protein
MAGRRVGVGAGSARAPGQTIRRGIVSLGG